MKVFYIDRLFSDKEIADLHACIEENYKIYDTRLGRMKAELINIPIDVKNKLEKFASELSGNNLKFSYALYLIYDKESGKPNLPPHIDADTNDLIFDYQIRSNTSWDLGLETKVYPLKDNSALIFNPNEVIHWRPHKSFEEGETVEMILFRLFDTNNRSDYTHLKYSQSNPIFKDALDFREKLRDNG